MEQMVHSNPQAQDRSAFVFFEDFEGDDVVFFEPNAGVAINVNLKRLVVFERRDGQWCESVYSLSELRGVREIVLQNISQETNVGTSPTRGIGPAIGNALNTWIGDAKARKGTGIQLQLKSVERPILFLKVPEDYRRQQFLEALRQVLEDAHVKTPYRTFPRDITKIFHKPEKADPKAVAAERRRLDARAAHLRVSWLGYLGLLAVSAFAVIPIFLVYREMVLANIGRAPNIEFLDFAIFFGCAAIAARILLGIYKLVRFWIWEVNQGTETTGQQP